MRTFLTTRLAATLLVATLASTPIARAQTGELKRGIDAYWAGDFSSAVTTLKRFLESAELRFDILAARKFLAFSYLAVDEDQRARAEFEQILAVDPDYDITAAEAAPSALKVWQAVKKSKDVERAERDRKQRADSVLDEAKQLFADEQYQQAQAKFREVLKLDPSNQWAKAYLQQLQDRLAGGAAPTPAAPITNDSGAPSGPATYDASPGGPENVTANPLDTIPSHPGETGDGAPPAASAPDVWVPSDPAEVANYNRAIKQNDRGLQYFREGNFAAARNEFERALQTYGRHPMFHWNLALAYARIHRGDLATTELKYLIKADPAGYGAKAHRELGMIYFGEQRWIEAARELEEALEIDGGDIDERRYLSMAYEQAGNLDMAIQSQVILVQQAPTSADDRYRLGDLHRRRGNTAAAVAEFRELLRLAPSYGQTASVEAYLKQNAPE